MRIADRFRLAFRAFQFSGSGPNISIGDMDRLMDLSVYGYPTVSGVDVSETTGTRQATVYSCIDILSRDKSALPVRLIESLPNGGRKTIKGHPVSKWLIRPNPAMTWNAYRKQGWQNYWAWGNEYSQIVRKRGGDIETWPLDAGRMEVEVREGRKWFHYRRADGTKRDFPDDEILHNFGYTVNGYWGISPIRVCMETIGHAIAAEIYGARSLDDPLPRLAFEQTEGKAFKDENDIASFLTRWTEKFSGIHGTHRASVLPRGLKPHQLRIPNDEMQFLETRKFNKEEIAQIYHVPMHRLNALDKATFSNIEHQGIEYVVYGLLPPLVGYEQAIAAKLLGPDEAESLSVKHNVDGLVRGDYKTRVEGNKAAIESGQLTPDEARALEEREPVQGGDKAYFPINFGPLGAPPRVQPSREAVSE